MSIRWHCPRPSEPRMFQEELLAPEPAPAPAPGSGGGRAGRACPLRAFPRLQHPGSSECRVSGVTWLKGV